MTYYISTYPTARNIAQQAHPSMRGRSLPVNVREEDNTYVLTALVPGISVEDLEIKVLDDTVTIEGKFAEDQNTYLMRELPRGAFYRSLQFPTALDADKSDAAVKDGLLTLRIARAESATPKNIKISAN
jgi:HSP20 family protein